MVETLVAVGATFLEVTGVCIILLGPAWAVGSAFLRREHTSGPLYRYIRHTVGRAILLGLELLVGADIIRTVAEIPTMRDVLILAMIVVIRTFLSFTLEVELEGRWPWQKQPSEAR